MRISRRRFLTNAARLAATSLLAGPSLRARPEAAGCASAAVDHCLLLDEPQCCVLPESLAGYEAALTRAGWSFRKAAMGAGFGGGTIIQPACGAIQPEAARRVLASLEAGACVVIESGGGFADQAAFAQQRQVLQRFFALRLEAPVNLWSGLGCEGSSLLHERVPYVEYTWPLQTKVRDFSRVVPLSQSTANVIGWIGNRPVAARLRVGSGTLIFLGSPLGPILLHGDPQGYEWVCRLIAAGISPRAQARLASL